MKLNEVIKNFNNGKEIFLKRHNNIYKVMIKEISDQIIFICVNINDEKDFTSVKSIFENQQMIESINGNKISIDNVDIKSFYLKDKKMDTYFIFDYINKKIVENNLIFESANLKVLDWDSQMVYKHIDTIINGKTFIDWLITWNDVIDENLKVNDNNFSKIDELKDNYPEFFDEHQQAVLNAIEHQIKEI